MTTLASTPSAAGALEGIRVVELALGWSACALCGTLLAELGAAVTTIDPDRDATAAALDAAKKRLTLTGDALARASEIVALIHEADVVLDDRMRTEALGLSEAVDRAIAANPRLVHCVVTPFGRTGPLRDAPGSELIVQAMSGVMATTGFPDDPPTCVGVPVGEHTASFYAGCGIVAALYRRLESGRGESIDIAIHDCLLTYLATFLPAYCQSRRNPERIGNLHPMVAPWNSYAAQDGWVIVCVGSDKQWLALTNLIGGDAIALADAYPTRESRLRHRDEIDATVTAWTRSRTVVEIVDALNVLDIPAGPIQTIADLVADPQVAARGLFEGSGGDATSLRLGPLFQGAPATRAAKTADPLPPHRRPTSDGGGPLAGVRVIECAAYTAGPLCARILADLGADVIKVEPPDGDPVRSLGGKIDSMSHIFHILNHGKASVTVDAKTAEGRTTLLALCADADVLLENLAPGVLARWGLDVATLHAQNPRLVYGSINGYGWNGPMGGKRAFDTVIQARASVLSQTGRPDGPPTKMGASLADVACAAFGAFALVAALYDVRRNQRGQFLDMAMFDVLARMSARACLDHLGGRAPERRIGNASSAHAPHNLYRAKDAFITIAVTDDAQWQRFARILGEDGVSLPGELSTARDRLSHSALLDGAVGAWVARQDVNRLLDRCQRTGVPAARVLDIGDVVAHPQVRERDMMPAIEIEDRPVLLLGSPIRFAGARPRRLTPAPALGAHNDSILGAHRALAHN